MTDRHDHERDELASAFLDGVATPDEAAMVRDDPALVARVDAFADVRDALRHDVPVPDPDERDEILASVLAQAPVSIPSLDVRRAARSARAARADRLRVGALAAVAALLLFGLVAGVVALSRTGDDQSASSSAAPARTATLPSTTDRSAGTPQQGGGADESKASDGGAAADTAAAGAGAAGGANDSVPIDLGAIASPDALRAAIVARGPSGPSSAPGNAATSAAPSTAAQAAPAAPVCPSVATPQFVARLEGRPVSVSIRGNEAVVYEASTCAVVAVFTL